MKSLSKKIRDDMRRELLLAYACRSFWWACMVEGDRRKEIVDAFNCHRDFFAYCLSAHYRTYILITTSLFDRDKRSITLRSLHRVALKNPSSQGESLAQVDIDICAAEKIGRQLYKIRSKHLAHRDSLKLSRNFYKEAGLTYDQMRLLWDDCWSIFSRLSYHIDQTVETPPTDYRAKFLDLVDAIHRAEGNKMPKSET